MIEPATARLRILVVDDEPAMVGAISALVGSAGLLEISARDASAAELTGAGRGTPVRVEPESAVSRRLRPG